MVLLSKRKRPKHFTGTMDPVYMSSTCSWNQKLYVYHGAGRISDILILNSEVQILSKINIVFSLQSTLHVAILALQSLPNRGRCLSAQHVLELIL